MQIKKLSESFSVLKLEKDFIPRNCEFYFCSKTDEEFSLVCPTEFAPKSFIERSDGWKCFKVVGTLDFSLVGILASITAALAESKIPVFAVSTFNTDYILVKDNLFAAAEIALKCKGYEVI